MQGINDSVWSLTLGEIQQERDKIDSGYHSPYREELNSEENNKEPESD
jgi:hypothetical protein